MTDYAVFAHVADVFVIETHRGKGLSKWLLHAMRTHPKMQGLRKWTLATSDAHGLYKQFGFSAPEKPQINMEIVDKNVYQNQSLV